MSKNEILEFKKFSKSATSASSPWFPKNDPELNMWKKTVIKQIAKTLPQNEVLAKAFEEDNKESDIKEYRKQAIIEEAKKETDFKMASLLPKETIKQAIEETYEVDID